MVDHFQLFHARVECDDQTQPSFDKLKLLELHSVSETNTNLNKQITKTEINPFTTRAAKSGQPEM